MKFLAFVDVHQDKKVVKKLVQRASHKDIDFLVCCGDISVWGRGLRDNLMVLTSIGKPLYFVPGNHEEKLSGLSEILHSFPSVIDLHQQAITVEKYVFMGYGGHGFSRQDPEFRKVARHWYGKYQGRRIVLVTHGPPIGTKLDVLDEQYVGSEDYRAFIERIKPKVVVCGHLHEAAGLVDSIGTTKLVNPGWEGMVVELK